MYGPKLSPNAGINTPTTCAPQEPVVTSVAYPGTYVRAPVQIGLANAKPMMSPNPRNVKGSKCVGRLQPRLTWREAQVQSLRVVHRV